MIPFLFLSFFFPLLPPPPPPAPPFPSLFHQTRFRIYMARTVGSLSIAPAITNVITRTRSLRAPLKLIIYMYVIYVYVYIRLVGIFFPRQPCTSARENMMKSRNLTNELFRYVDTRQTIDVGGVEKFFFERHFRKTKDNTRSNDRVSRENLIKLNNFSHLWNSFVG